MPVDVIAAARLTLRRQLLVAEFEAQDLGHKLGRWEFRPDLGLAFRTKCERCGRALRVTVIPGGTFTDERIIRSAWLGQRVRCKK